MTAKKISDLAITNEGFLKHTDLKDLYINSVPKFLFTKVFSYSDRQSERFLTALVSLYKDPVAKPIIDVIAVHMSVYDDLAILFGATLGTAKLGQYSSNIDEMNKRISKLPPNEREAFSKILQIILPSSNDSLENFKKIEIQSFLVGKNLTSIIAHEFAHLMAEIIFDNLSFGYNNPHQKAIYDAALYSFALKLMQAYNIHFQNDTYSTLNGKELLNIENSTSISNNSSHLISDPKYNQDILKSLVSFAEFVNIFLISSNSYNDCNLIDCEIFARIFESFISYNDNDWHKKFLGEFKPYIDLVLNPAIDKYFNMHIDAVKNLNIQSNEHGSYGIDTNKITTLWSLSEKLYFAVVNDDITHAKNLIEQGANSTDLVFGIHKIIDVALKRNQYDLVKFICEKSTALDLSSLNITNQTTLDLAQSLGEEALSCFKNTDVFDNKLSASPLIEQATELVETHPLTSELL